MSLRYTGAGSGEMTPPKEPARDVVEAKNICRQAGITDRVRCCEELIERQQGIIETLAKQVVLLSNAIDVLVEPFNDDLKYAFYEALRGNGADEAL